MADDLTSDSAVLSDVDDDDDPTTTAAASTTTASEATTTTTSSADHRIRDLLAELDQERLARKSAEENLKKRDDSLSRLKAFAQDIIKKRDEILKEKENLKSESEALRKDKETLKSEMETLRKERDAIKVEADAAVKEKETIRAEAESAVQILTSSIEKVSIKIARFKNFGEIPRTNKYGVGLPAVAYGVIKWVNEVVEEMIRQIEIASKERDGARGQIDQRNYEVAIEVSRLESTIDGLREEVAEMGKEIGKLEALLLERDREVTEMRWSGEERNNRVKDLVARMEAQRPVVIEQLSNISKTYKQVNEIVRIADGELSDKSLSDSSFVWEEMDMDANLKALSKGIESVFEMAKVATEKVRGGFEEKDRTISGLEEKVDDLVAEKQHIGTLLRSALSSKTNEVLQVAESGLREAGIELKFNGHDENGGGNSVEEDEVYSLAGALENTVKASKLQIVELVHLVEALRAESSLHKAHLDAQAKEIGQLKLQIKELEKKELVANESVEGLMMDIAAAEEEIARWKAAAEQEAAAGGAVEQEFLSQLSALRHELEEAKKAMSEMEKKLKFKEETAIAAMAARDAAENSLKLADTRSTRLRERLEELSRQFEENDNRKDLRNNQNDHRYVCWPWQWLGLNSVRYQSDDLLENSNEMELSEPLV